MAAPPAADSPLTFCCPPTCLLLHQSAFAAQATCLQNVKARGIALVDISNYVPGDTDVCDGSAPASSGVWCAPYYRAECLG